MQEDLYSPILATREVERTKSYNIANLFYVAFFGGVVAMSVLGIRNSKWLQIEKKYIRLLTAMSILHLADEEEENT